MKNFLTLPSTRVAVISRQAALAAIGAAALSLFSLSAVAQLPPPQQQVDFDDLDLSKAHDTQRLYRRLRTAAASVCSGFADRKSVRAREQYRECTSRALNDAIAVIAHPSLTALHAAKNETKLAQRKGEAASQS